MPKLTVHLKVTLANNQVVGRTSHLEVEEGVAPEKVRQSIIQTTLQQGLQTVEGNELAFYHPNAFVRVGCNVEPYLEVVHGGKKEVSPRVSDARQNSDPKGIHLVR